jgi:hypothetical protein
LFGKGEASAASSEFDAERAAFIKREIVVEIVARLPALHAQRRARAEQCAQRVCDLLDLIATANRTKELQQRSEPANWKDQKLRFVERRFLPVINPSQKASRPMPSGVTHPIPVITTRRGRVNALNMRISQPRV